MTHQWEEYWNAGPATDASLSHAERLLGVVFPSDFVDLMREHQGKVPTPRMLRIFDDGPLVKFGPVMHVNPERGSGYIPATVQRFRRGGYPEGLVPFADAGSQTHFALDYRLDPRMPVVVYVIPEFGYDDPDAFVVVASGVTDLLARLQPDDQSH